MSLLKAAALALALLAAAPAVAAAQPKPPVFDYDVGWMKVPSQWVTGAISAVAVDRNDNVWVLHRPRTAPEADRGRAAPPVMQFDRNGRFLRGWGGPGEGYDWPTNEHSLFVDGKDRVWLTGSSRVAPGDQMLLAFTADGRFIRQIGRRGAGAGDLDTANLNAPADLFVDTPRNEIYVADGYGNRRVIVFDTETGQFKRMWGAFGSAPPATPMGPPLPVTKPPGSPGETGEGPAEFRSVHGVELAKDGTLYVSDRDNHRVQVFDRFGHYQTQVFINRDAPFQQTAAGLGLSPDQRWLYVLDGGNSQMLVLDRRTLRVVSTLGGLGRAPGQMNSPHIMAVDSKGAVYIAEVVGFRLQKLTPKP